MSDPLSKVKRRRETVLTWGPYAIAVAWWVSFLPGFFSSDSFGALKQAAGTITPAYTAIWPLFLRVATNGGRYPAGATLIGVLVLTYAVQIWATNALRGLKGRRAAVMMTATPLVGAVGITLWHDVFMTSGLLIAAAVMSSTDWFQNKPTKGDATRLITAAVLSSFRPNGPATFALFFLLGWVLVRRLTVAMYGACAICVAFGVWIGATVVTGNQSLVMPVFAQEWMRGDLSCVLSRNASDIPRARDAFAQIGGVQKWSTDAGCWGLNPLGLESSQIERSLTLVPSIWLSTALAAPVAVFRAHLDRNAYLVPIPSRQAFRTPFIHSTIEFPDRGIEWANPRWAGFLRNYIRAWNAARSVLAFAGLWLIVLIVVHLRPIDGVVLGPTIVMCVALVVLLFITAPIPDARYALAVLITGQTTLVAISLRRLLEATTPANEHS